MITGSIVSDGPPAFESVPMRVLTLDGIRAKHDLSVEQFEAIKGQIHDMKFLDVLFHFPDGPRYDIALYLVATSR
jgi:hypothetical protein